MLVVAGDTTADEVMKLAEKHFGGIPSRPLPPRPDIKRAAADRREALHREDKLARTPALAFGYHLPDRMTKDFFALTLLDPLLVSDESARLYQALIKENQIASDVSGGFNYGSATTSTTTARCSTRSASTTAPTQGRRRAEGRSTR